MRTRRTRGNTSTMQTYTLRRIQSMLGISRAVVDALVESGFVQPARGARRELRFTFQDVVLLRTAHALQSAQVPPRKILRALKRLKAQLPEELPLTGLRIVAVGAEVAVKEGDAHWHADSGQLLMDFELREDPGGVRLLNHPEHEAQGDAEDAQAGAAHWFDRGVELELFDPPRAEDAYRAALKAWPSYTDAYLNLGAMLCEAGRCADAVELYGEALRQGVDEALVHFNLGVALEDLGLAREALQAYDAALRMSPTLADAHFNAARLHEQLGHKSRAIRHYAEYRRLSR